MDRRRSLLAASMQSGGNGLEFPIYLETVKVATDEFYRESDEKSIALLDWIETHLEPDSWGDPVIPENILLDNPIYILMEYKLN